MDDPDWSPRPLDILLGYEPGMTMPSAEEHGSQWHPEWCPKNKKTENGYWLWQKSTKLGYATWCDKDWFRLEKRCRRVAKKCRAKVHALIERGIIDMSGVEDSEKAHAVEALTYAVSVLREPKVQVQTKLAAAKLVLDFTKTKPVQKVENTIRAAEDILDALDE